MFDQLDIFADHPAADYRDGLTDADRATLAAARRILSRIIAPRDVLTSWQAVLDYLAATMGADRAESFRVLYLDKKNRLIADEEQQRGTVDHVPVYPREIARRAVMLDACAVILAHNHPSGDPTPSKADKAMTKTCAAALDALGIVLHDHVIIGGPDAYSMKSRGDF
jgi:DNA repair protein RadC